MRIVQEGATSQSVNVYAIDNTTGLAKTGLAFGSAGIGIAYRRDNAAVVSITLVTLAALTTAWTSGGFLEIGNGWYRLDVPDAAFVTGTTSLLIEGTVTGAQFLTSPIQLAGFAGGLPLSDASGRVDIGSLIGVAQSAIDLKDFADTGYDPATKKVQGVVLVDTTSVNTDMRGTDAAATAITIGTPIDIDIATDVANIQTTVNNIGTGSSGAVNFKNVGDNTATPLKGITFRGIQTSGSNASINAQDQVYHNISDGVGADLNFIDIVYEFNISGSKTATSITCIGRLNGNNDTITLQAYNGTSFETIGSISGQGVNNITDVEKIFPLFPLNTGIGADLGKIFIRIVTLIAGTNPNLFIDSLILQAINVGDSVGYVKEAVISIDTNNGTAGTDPTLNGTADNPVLTLADALIISAAKNINTFELITNSSIAFSSDQENTTYDGTTWVLALGGASINGSTLRNCFLDGIGLAATVAPIVEMVRFGTVSLDTIMARNCGFRSGTYTATAAKTHVFHECHSMVAGITTPNFDFNSLTGVSVSFEDYSGGMTFNNMVAGDTLTFDGTGQLIIAATCTGGTIRYSGNIKLTDNVVGGFTGTITKDDIITKLESLDTVKVPDVISLANIRTQSDDSNIAYDAPTNAEMNARTLPSGSYFDPFNDIVADVTNVNNVSLILDKTNYQIAGVKKTLDQLNDITAASVWTSTTRTLTAFSTTLALSMWSVLLASISISGSIGLRFKELLGLTITGNVDTSTFVSTTTVFETNLIETTTDHYKDQLLKFTSGSLAGQQTSIDSYVFSANSKGKFTVVGLTESPSNGTTFEIT